MTERQKRGFLGEDPSKEFDESHPELYAKSRNARSLEDSLFWWSAVFEHQRRGGRWSGKNPPANRVREMLTRDSFDQTYVENHYLDEIAYTTDSDLVHEVERQERKEGIIAGYSAIENNNPQLHEFSLDVMVTVKALILEVLSVCNYVEKRLFAFILVENNLHVFLEMFDSGELGDFSSIIEELYSLLREEEEKPSSRNQRGNDKPLKLVGKRKFVAQGKSRHAYTLIVNSFEKKVRPLFFPDRRGD